MNEIRTVTTNNTNPFGLMEKDMRDVFLKTMDEHQKQMMSSLLFDGMTNKFMKPKPVVHRRVIRATSRSRTVSYPNGYWAKITVDDNDHVIYMLYHSGWLAKLFHKLGFRKVVSGGADSVKQRDTVEATLGATYMAIDEAIADDLKTVEHSKFLKDMIKTDPENLKAIAQLDMLDKGDGPGSDQGASSGVAAPPPSSSSPPAPVYTSNIKVSGAGAYFMKDDPTKPASVMVGPMALEGGNTNSLSCGKEDLISVEPGGEVSFGNKMAKAIKKAVQAKGEEDGT